MLDLNQDENVTLARLPMLDVQDVLAYVHDTVGLRSPSMLRCIGHGAKEMGLAGRD